MQISFPREVRCNLAGYSWLARTGAQLEPLRREEIRFCGRGLSWFDANLCGPFGAILTACKLRLNTVSLDEIPAPIIQAWGQNGFYRHFGGADFVDHFDTTIGYRRFTLDEDKTFVRYLRGELMEKELPTMSRSAKARFESNVQEVFTNAVHHSFSVHGVFSCGQHFPHKNRLDLTLTDLGVGFGFRVSEFLNAPISSLAAIEWALEQGHTTRVGNIAGGLGLKRLAQFLAQNEGHLQILSGDGFYQQHGGKISRQTLRHSFGGSVVNLSFNTLDATFYSEDDETSAGEEIAIFG